MLDMVVTYVVPYYDGLTKAQNDSKILAISRRLKVKSRRLRLIN